MIDACDTTLERRSNRTWRGAPRRAVPLIALCLVLLGPGSAAAIETTTDLAAGNGGTATIDGDGSITTGDIITGQNSGSDVRLGDVQAHTVSVAIGALSNETDQEFAVKVGPHNASASGGRDAVAHGGRPGQPVDLDLTVEVDTGVDVRNDNNNHNSNQNDNDIDLAPVVGIP